MNVLDSPLEALAFDYVSFGIFAVVNNLWTWVALITAAVSFWKIRSTGGSTTITGHFSNHNCIDSCCGNELTQKLSVLDEISEHQVDESDSRDAQKITSSSLPRTLVFEDDVVTKGKFVMYFEDERTSSEEDNGNDDELTVVSEWGCVNEWENGWERVMKLRMGEMGWYRCQDLTAINGNVVRLWEDVRNEKYNSSCMVW